MNATITVKGELTDEQKQEFRVAVQAFVDNLDEEIAESDELEFDVNFS